MILDKTAAALYTTLNAGTALTSQLAGTTSIYDTQAPDNATLPFVVFSHQAGGPENVDPNNLEQNVWYVRAYSATSAKTASEIFEQADLLLNKNNITIQGYNTLWCAREEDVKLMENLPNGGKVWSAGGFYRIRTSDYSDMGYDWFVDSVNGSDSNSGRNAERAFATIAKLLTQTIASGETVALAKGSTWREKLSIPASSVTTVTYGSGAAPLLDCSVVAANASFTKTVGQTNVYQIAVTVDYSASEPMWNSVWENDVRLVRATSLANCDATPGSMYPSNDNAASVTLYVHASDSSSVITNGKTYEYAKWLSGYYSYFATGCGLNGIRSRRNLALGGSIKVGKTSIVVDCAAEDGNSHNFYCRTGCWIENVTASGAYYAASTMGLFAYNEDTPANEGITYVNCHADMDGVYNALQTAYMGHKNTSGNFGNITYSGCAAADCNQGWNGQDATIYLTNCTVSNCCFGVSPQVNTIISGGTWTCTVGSGRLINNTVTNGLTITISGLTGTSSESGLFNSQATATFILASSTLTSTSGYPCVWMMGATSNTLTSNGNTLTGDTMYRFQNANYTFSGDNNNYNPTGQMYYGGGAKTFAQWQAAVTPQDANSTVG